MTASDADRKLAAILCADITGYARLMDDDEKGTVRTLRSWREQIGALVVEHRGRIEYYDRGLEGVFAVQSEIAEQVFVATGAPLHGLRRVCEGPILLRPNSGARHGTGARLVRTRQL